MQVLIIDHSAAELDGTCPVVGSAELYDGMRIVDDRAWAVGINAVGERITFAPADGCILVEDKTLLFRVGDRFNPLTNAFFWSR